MASSPFSVRLSPELKQRVEAVAEREDRSSWSIARWTIASLF
jgi:predicted transcriptional regulator